MEVQDRPISVDSQEVPESKIGTILLADVLMVALSALAVGLLVFEVVADHSQEQSKALEYADITIAFVFLAEFLFRFYKAPHRLNFFKNHWWELLASVPISTEATQLLRGLRLIRLVRLIRLLRLVRLAIRMRIVLEASERLAQHTYVVQIASMVAIVAVSGALGFHYFEADTNKNVHSFWDSFWWAMVTITTIGYGDIYPVTTGGRVIAIFLMFTGIGTLSVMTATIAAYFIKEKKSEDNNSR